MKKHTGVKEEK